MALSPSVLGSLCWTGSHSSWMPCWITVNHHYGSGRSSLLPSLRKSLAEGLHFHRDPLDQKLDLVPCDLSGLWRHQRGPEFSHHPSGDRSRNSCLLSPRHPHSAYTQTYVVQTVPQSPLLRPRHVALALCWGQREWKESWRPSSVVADLARPRVRSPVLSQNWVS